MNEKQKVQLDKMMEMNKDTFIDQTELIRQLKHSAVFRREIATLQGLMAKYPDEPENVAIEAITECSFLCTYYTDIYNKIRKQEIDLGLLHQFIDILEEIEDGKQDQTTASVKVGEILKRIYVDSALKKAKKLDAANQDQDGEKEAKKEAPPAIPISYSQFKQIMGNKN